MAARRGGVRLRPPDEAGDCGAQSMYFSALCRSLGIPARTTGGWQLFSGNFGDHFWAEFFLPNYGWLPVDPTAAELSLYPPDLTDQQRKVFIDFYFGVRTPCAATSSWTWTSRSSRPRRRTC